MRSHAIQGGRRGDCRADRNQVPALPDHHIHRAGRAPPTRTPRASGGRALWLFIPLGTLDPETRLEVSRSARDTAAWSSACTSRNPGFEPFASLSGTPSRRPPSWPGWKTRPWIRRLSGMTLPPSTAGLGVARWISSLRATPASPSAPAGTSADLKTRATSGPTSPASRASASRSGSSSRTSRDTCPWALPTSPESYRTWALRQKRACSRRLRSALGTGAGASSCWPTPTACTNGNHPLVEVGPDGVRFIKDRFQPSLLTAARTWLAIRILQEAGLMTSADCLSSLRVHLSIRLGPECSAPGRTFNPNFSDWMMGWPSGWTDPEAPATEWSHWLQRSRTALSELPSTGLLTASEAGEVAAK